MTDIDIEAIRKRVEAASGPYGMDGDVQSDFTPNEVLALLTALEAANKRADEAEKWRQCYECGSEMTACAQCNPELPTAELTTLRARVAELEGALTEARAHFIRVEYDGDGNIASVGHHSEALAKIVTTLDAALNQKEPTNAG